MVTGLLLFCLGVMLPGYFPSLPDLSAIAWLGVAAVLSLIRRRTRVFAGLSVGLVVGIWSGHQWLEQSVPTELIGQELGLRFVVQTAPERIGDRWRFRAQILGHKLRDRRLQLSWLEEPPPGVGELWEAKAKVFPPRGSVNFGLYDYEAWQLSQGLHGSGYIVPGEATRLKSAPLFWYELAKLRAKISLMLDAHVPEAETRGALAALVIGSSSQLDSAVWQTLTRTGTNHLFVVSGLHVGLVATVLLGVVRFVGFGKHFTLIFLIVFLTGYAMLVGFGLPVQRALLMTVLVLVVVTYKREVPNHRIVVFALSTLLLGNPFAPLNAGFWLSFGAVIGLLAAYSGHLFTSLNRLWVLVETQWIALIVTAPVLIVWIGQIPLSAMLGNLFAVPVVGFFVIPLVLLFVFLHVIGFEPLTLPILGLLTSLMRVVLDVLALFAELGWSHIPPLVDGGVICFFVLGSVILLLPRYAVPRWLGLLCWLPLFAIPRQSMDDYLKVNVLDVGQGLAVIVTGPDTTIVYDTGPSSARSDAVQQTVMPALKNMGRTFVDLLVVSHGDDDHAGGVKSLVAALPIANLLSSDRMLGKPCNSGHLKRPDMLVTWFALTGAERSRNAASCVLRIASKHGSILLPGDIDAESEFHLLSQTEPTDLLVSPHHGSRSSSSPAFLNRVGPNWVVHSAGFFSPFGHPHAEVLARYHLRGVRQLNTAISGGIEVTFFEQEVVIREARHAHPRFWYDASPSVGLDLP